MASNYIIRIRRGEQKAKFILRLKSFGVRRRAQNAFLHLLIIAFQAEFGRQTIAVLTR